MKKFFTLFLIIMFLLANTPMALSIHWCGGKLTYFGVINHSESKCSCGMEMPAGCCKDVELQANAITDDCHSHITKISYSKICDIAKISVLELPDHFYSYPLILKVSLSFHAPPLKNVAPAFLLFCNFLI